MPSVALKILDRLVDRLGRIDGTGKYNFDMRGLIYRCQPRHNIATGGKKAIFIARRAGGDERAVPRHAPQYETVVVFDVFAIVPATVAAGTALEQMLEDIERALEDVTDRRLRDAETGNNLLSENLHLADALGELPEEWNTVEAVAVGVVCQYAHVYGSPEIVTK